MIIFSQKGKRPAPNKMSCGDLDGDVYFVTWNKSITDHVKSVFDPAPL